MLFNMIYYFILHKARLLNLNLVLESILGFFFAFVFFFGFFSL